MPRSSLLEKPSIFIHCFSFFECSSEFERLKTRAHGHDSIPCRRPALAEYIARMRSSGGSFVMRRRLLQGLEGSITLFDFYKLQSEKKLYRKASAQTYSDSVTAQLDPWSNQ